MPATVMGAAREHGLIDLPNTAGHLRWQKPPAVYGMVVRGKAATLARLLCLLAIVHGGVGMKILN